jgi:hypothetical protein
MTNIRSFLHNHSTTLIIPSLQTINLLQKFDQPIIDLQIISTYSKSDAEMINACRVFLQVTTLSKISNHQGTKILQEAYLGELLERGLPAIQVYSKSHLNWPFQAYPPRKAWILWKLLLTQFANASWDLRQPLGPWYDNVHEQRKWYYLHQGRHILHVQECGTCIFEPTISRTRNRQKFTLGPMINVQVRPTYFPITPHLIQILYTLIDSTS